MLLTLVIGWPASAMRGDEAGHNVAGVSIVVAGSLHSATDTLTVDSRVAKSQYFDFGMSLLL